MKKLVCDRCGFELTKKNDVELALEGSEAWKTAVRARGGEAKGFYPCQNFIRCQGEMKLIIERRIGWCRLRKEVLIS